MHLQLAGSMIEVWRRTGQADCTSYAWPKSLLHSSHPGSCQEVAIVKAKHRSLRQSLACRPDVIHVSTPGLMVFSAIMYAKMLAIPLVVSYHTHVVKYIPK